MDLFSFQKVTGDQIIQLQMDEIKLNEVVAKSWNVIQLKRILSFFFRHTEIKLDKFFLDIFLQLETKVTAKSFIY